MEIIVGDKVKFLNNVGGGKVTRIIDKNTVAVLTEDDWEMPILKKELVRVDEVIEKQAYNSKYKTPPRPEERIIETVEEEEEEDDFFEEMVVNTSDDVNIYLAFVPQNPVNPTNSDLNTYLVNDSNYHLLYNIMQPNGEKYTSKMGMLESNTKLFLEMRRKTALNETINYAIQLMFYKPLSFTKRSVVEKEISINPLKFVKLKSFKSNDFFDESSLIFPVVEDRFREEVRQLTEEDIKKVIAQKEVESQQINQPKSFKKVVNPAEKEEIVDLHIHELVDDFSLMKPKDIIDLQLNRFRTELDNAIEHRIKSITFIHGIGNGTLKHEIRRELEKKYAKYTFQDASFKEYGFGATMVLIR